VFAATGGIEKVCRILGKALYENDIEGKSSVRVFSMYDKQSDAYQNIYFPVEIFKGFGTSKIKFILQSIYQGIKSDTIIISHINLVLVGWVIKQLRPQKKIILFAHGIEIWRELGFFKKKMLLSCDVIIPVSNFTSGRILDLHGISPSVCKVLNNCLDPFMPLGNEYKNDGSLKEKYGFKKTDTILFTLCRLSSKERYKGYDKVIQCLPTVLKKYPDVKYLLAGSYDDEEKKYLEEMAHDLGVSSTVKLVGFVPDEDLVAHFMMSDIYIMPSMKEGFGIVFIEAMFYGLPVIAGNRDGSVDALLNGDLGLLIDPMQISEITTALNKILENKNRYIPKRNKMLSQFSYDIYKTKLENILTS